MKGHVQTKFLLDDRHQHIDADGDPDLRPHSVLGSAVEAFDAQVLLDPLEEQLSGEELARCRTLRLRPFPVPPHKNCS